MSAAVTVRGAAELDRTARAAAAELERLDAVNARVAAGILAACNPPRLTGRLAGSLTASSTATEATVTSSVRYAPFVERRTHFAARALDSRRSSSVALYAGAVTAAVGSIRGA